MNCPLCTKEMELPVDKETTSEHLIITKDFNGHYHVHGPLNNTEEILTMLSHLCIHSDIDLKTQTQPKVKGVPVTKKELEDKSLSPEQKRLRKKYDTKEASTYRTRSA